MENKIEELCRLSFFSWIYFLEFLGSIFLLVVFCWLSLFFGKKYFVKFFDRCLKNLHPQWAPILIKNKLIYYGIHIIPGIIFHLGSKILLSLFIGISFSISFSYVLLTIADLYLMVVIMITLNCCLNACTQVYELYPISKRMPLRSYAQVIKITIFILGVTLCLSIILHKSLVGFFTGIGAAMALILLVFKDTILGFVASLQVSFYDIMRIGDRVSIPHFNVEGHVEEISISTVKVRNFDKTISNIPTHTLIEKGVQNWRGMEEMGGRRLRRSLPIDIDTIQFCTDAMLKKYHTLSLLHPALKTYLKNQDNEKLTNIAVFRMYAEAYLRQRKDVHQEKFIFLIRHLEPSQNGLPIEVYVFLKVLNIKEFEQIQGEIFDHLIAMLPTFKLRAFQAKSL